MKSTQLSVPLNQLAASEFALQNYKHNELLPSASLPVPNPTNPFWLEQDANPLAKHGSEGDLSISDADICIIGSGITGVSAAYHLSKSLVPADTSEGGISGKTKIVILEARDFCSGATGRNGGHLTANAFLGTNQRVRDWGLEDAKRQLLLEHYTVSEIVKILRENDLEEEVDLVPGGHVSLLFTKDELHSARHDFESAKEAGINLSEIEWLDEDEILNRYGASYPGFFEPGYNLWPSKLVTQLFYLAHKAPHLDLHLYTSAPVTRISKSSLSSRRWTVETPRGNITTNYIIHATNAYASHLIPSLTGPKGIIPTRGQVIATRASVTSEKLSRVGWGANDGFEYWFPRPIDRSRSQEKEHPLVILGGGREASGPGYELYQTDDGRVNPDVGKVLRRFLPEVFPGKYEPGKDPEMEWTGIMGFTKSGDPFVGPVQGSNLEGQFVSAGFSGHGMPRAFACAQVLAEMISSSMRGTKWSCPPWLPRHYLTLGSAVTV